MDSSEQLVHLYNDLAALQRDGKAAEAQALLQERFAQLPEDVQGELLAHLYLNSLTQKIEREDSVAIAQAKGLEALDALDILKKKIGEGSAS
jgi:hypothetical protein